ncbi:MAG: hypothetical protein HWE39_09225 [Oceanospirillaceae bacterium]|nr:hypothetical protein [Oceanospirillaceae bacterium]
MGKRLSGGSGRFLGCAALLLAASPVLAKGPVDLASPQPGLEVCYIDGFIRHIDEMVRKEGSRDCDPGPVLPQLNYSTGGGNVLTSKSNDGVMARITGFIHLDQTGSYTFAFESNDGVRLEIDGAMILEDPDVHSDQFSDYGYLEVSEPGWYPVLIRYFERKNTSTLRFHWQPPGTEGTMPLVPAEALAHGS